MMARYHYTREGIRARYPGMEERLGRERDETIASDYCVSKDLVREARRAFKIKLDPSLKVRVNVPYNEDDIRYVRWRLKHGASVLAMSLETGIPSERVAKFSKLEVKAHLYDFDPGEPVSEDD